MFQNMQDWLTAYQALSERAKLRHENIIIRDWSQTCVTVWDDLVNNGYDEIQLMSRGWHYEKSQTDFQIMKKLVDDTHKNLWDFIYNRWVVSFMTNGLFVAEMVYSDYIIYI